jgi:hypothetical protein
VTLAVKDRAPVGVDRTGRLFDPGSGPSLDDSVSAVWESLALRGRVGCLVCGETLVLTDDHAPEAECAACGSRLE